MIFGETKNKESGSFQEKINLSFSLSDIKSKVPRVNLKKIKLSKIQNLGTSLEKRSVTRITLDDRLANIGLPFCRSAKEKIYETASYNPLRKKIEEEEKLPEIDLLIDEEVQEVPEEIPLEEKKDVTFNLDAEILNEEELVIFSPATVSLPPFKEDILSSSGEQAAFVWPPVQGQEQKIKKVKKTKKKKSKKSPKKKPYFLIEEKPVEKQVVRFPWTSESEGENYQTLESIVQGGLESVLLDTPALAPSQALPFSKETVPVLQVSQEQVIFKAIIPRFEPGEDVDLQNIKNSTFFARASKLNYGIELQGRIKKMFEKIGSAKITPIRIIIFGGFVATIGYLVYGYFFPDFQLNYINQEQKDNVVVRDLFKQKHVYKKDLVISKGQEKISLQSEMSLFKPITEQERLSLIQKAREALENRLDPFGQEGVLPRSVIEQKKKEQEEKAIPDIELVRKQVELVGVISSKESDLALVNLYSAEYTVSTEDEDSVRETKLKTAISMAVPNRLEVSVLDPVESWYVKQIQKSKSRNEDPYIELVKENKKFKLKVGQKVLLPEEQVLEETEAEDVKQPESAKS